MGQGLPGWVVSDGDSLRQEAAPYVGMTPQERFRVLSAVCRAAARMARARTDLSAVLAYQDPLPESTVVALARLRATRKSA